MSGWGTGWDKGQWGKFSTEPTEWNTELGKAEQDAQLYGTGWVRINPGCVEHVPIEKVRSNLKPTHDPYTNPGAHIYYECGCGAILDPGTKSFAQLNNCASDAGWKVRWGADSYIPYCVKCGEDIE